MFHVPERFRLRDHPLLGTTSADGNNGAFDLDSPAPGWRLALICSDGSELGEFLCNQPHEERWEHVSIHAYRGRSQRTPTWDEMCFIKRLCWDAEDVVMQLHPRESVYVNCHPHTLHLWRPVDSSIPEPPSIFVGVKS